MRTTLAAVLILLLPHHAGHPVNAQGFVTDGSPQRDDAHCVGSAFQRGACLAARRGFNGGMRLRNATEACIVRRESRGNYNAWNPGGYYGRYQMSDQLWSTYGGQADWGAASPGEQDWVFTVVVAHDGYSPWCPWDGC